MIQSHKQTPKHAWLKVMPQPKCWASPCVWEEQTSQWPLLVKSHRSSLPPSRAFTITSISSHPTPLGNVGALRSHWSFCLKLCITCASIGGCSLTWIPWLPLVPSLGLSSQGIELFNFNMQSYLSSLCWIIFSQLNWQMKFIYMWKRILQ